MSWFAAHLLVSVKLKEAHQGRFPLWENIILLKADSEDEAFAKAEARGRAEEGDDDGTFHWGDKPARRVFAGVRKLTSCQDPEQRPGDGTEISFIEMEAASQATIEKLLDGDHVSMRFMERFEFAAPERGEAGAT